MDDKPPPLPPTPPPPAQDPWREDYETYRPVQRPASGGVIAIGILNLIFALVCGCTHGLTSAVLSEVRETDKDIFFSDWDRQMDSVYDEMLQTAESDSERDEIERQRAFMKSTEVKEAMRETVTLLATSESGARLRHGTTAGLVVQILMLLSGALLLARVRVARPLALAATFLTMLVQIVLLVFTLGIVDELELALGDRLDQAARENSQNFDPATREFMEDNVTAMFSDLMRVSALGMTGIAVVYPLVAFLVLLLSRSIRRALDDDPVAAKPDVF